MSSDLKLDLNIAPWCNFDIKTTMSSYANDMVMSALSTGPLQSMFEDLITNTISMTGADAIFDKIWSMIPLPD